MSQVSISWHDHMSRSLKWDACWTPNEHWHVKKLRSMQQSRLGEPGSKVRDFQAPRLCLSEVLARKKQLGLLKGQSPSAIVGHEQFWQLCFDCSNYCSVCIGNTLEDNNKRT